MPVGDHTPTNTPTPGSSSSHRASAQHPFPSPPSPGPSSSTTSAERAQWRSVGGVVQGMEGAASRSPTMASDRLRSSRNPFLQHGVHEPGVAPARHNKLPRLWPGSLTLNTNTNYPSSSTPTVTSPIRPRHYSTFASGTAPASIPSYLQHAFGHTRKQNGSLQLKKAALLRSSPQEILNRNDWPRPEEIGMAGKQRHARTASTSMLPFMLPPNTGNVNGERNDAQRMFYADPEQVEDEEDDDDTHTQGNLSEITDADRSKRTSYYPPGYLDLDDEVEEQSEECHSTVQGSVADEELPSKPQTPLRNASSYAHLEMGEAIPGLVAVTSVGEYERYKRGYAHPVVFGKERTIPPLTTWFGGPAPPDGWKTFVHPEGTRYFYDDSPNLPVPVVTEAWIYDPAIRDRLRDYRDKIFDYMAEHAVTFPRPSAPPIPPLPKKSRSKKSKVSADDDETYVYPQDLAPVVLVLELRLSGRVGYYFVSHPTQTLFWLDPFDFTYMLQEVRVEHSDWLVGLQMKCHYWYHNELFPHLYELTDDDVEEADDIVGFGVGDVLTASTSSTINSDLRSLRYMQHIVHRYEQKGKARRSKSYGERQVICRIVSEFYSERFLNLFGERGARLNAIQSIHYSPYRRQKPVDPQTPIVAPKKSWYTSITSIFSRFPWRWRKSEENEEGYEDADPPMDPTAKTRQRSSFFMNVFSLVMFGGPGLHVRRLRDLTVDSNVSRNGLTKFTEKLVEEWRDITLYATVILSANVSFLTIQSVDDAGRTRGVRTNAQRASYFSILSSMGTIVLGLFLLRQHRDAMNFQFVSNRSVSRWGLESLALMYGLPFAFLIWSMISFFASFAFLWYTSADFVVVATVSVSCFVFAVVLAWAVSAGYESDPFRAYAGTVVRKAKRVGGKVTRGTVRVVKSAKKKMSIGGTKRGRSDSVGGLGGLESGGVAETKLPEFHVTKKKSASYGSKVKWWVGRAVSLCDRKRSAGLADGNRIENTVGAGREEAKTSSPY